MATQNAINIPLPIAVSNGGTGATTLTDHGILVGSGTAAIDALSVGVTGTLLAGSTGSNPVFTSSLDGNFTFTSATAGTERIITINNTDDTDSSSSATVQLTTGGSSAGDPAVKFTVTGVTNYSLGIDNSDSDKLKISSSNTLGTTDSWVMTTAGERTMPLQPAALSYHSTGVANVTGDGTVYTVETNTEVYDQSNNLSTTTWTAPVTGKYLCSINLQPNTGTTTGPTELILKLVTSNRTYLIDTYPGRKRINNFFGPNSWKGTGFVCLCDFDAADTATVTVTGSGGSKNAGVYGYGTPISFLLVC